MDLMFSTSCLSMKIMTGRIHARVAPSFKNGSRTRNPARDGRARSRMKIDENWGEVKGPV